MKQAIFCFLAALIYSCSPEVTFTNSHSRSFNEVFTDIFMLENPGLPGVGLKSVTLKIYVDGNEFNVANLKNNNTAAEQKVEKGGYHDWAIDLQITATNDAGIYALPLAYISEKESEFDELWESVRTLKFHDGDKVDLDIKLLDPN